VRDRSQPRARPPGEDESLEALHAGKNRERAPPRAACGRTFTYLLRKSSATLPGGWGSVGAAELAVVPARDANRAKPDGRPFSRLRLERGGRVALDRLEAFGVAERQLLGHGEHRLVVAVDLRLGLDLHAAELRVVVARLDEHGRAAVALQVSDLLRLQVGVDPDLA